MLILGLIWWLFAIEVIFTIAILFSVGNRRPFLGGFLTFGALLTWWAFSGFPNIIDLLRDNGQAIIFWGVAYLLAGFAWGVVNWLLYTRSEEMRTTIQYNYKQFQRGFPDGTLNDFKESGYYPFGFQKDFPFIANSVIWWPLSMAWTVLDDFLLNLVTFLGRQFSGFFAFLAHGALDSALKDVDTAKKTN